MAIIQILTETPGQINTPNIRRVRIITTDSLATVTTAGYLNQASLQGNTIYNTDEIVMWYGATATASGITNPGTFETFTASIANGIITLVVDVSGGNVLLPVVSNNFASFNGTSGQIKDGGYLPSDSTKTRVVMAGSATAIGIMAKFVDITGTIDDTAGAVSNLGNISAGASGTAGTFISFPTTAANGSFIWAAVGNAGNFNATVSPISTLGQSTVYTIPDAGAATAKFLLDTGTNASGTFTTLTATTANITNLKYGATPVAQVDPASCTITAVAGAANTSTITVQLKDGSGTNMTRSIQFKVYSSSAADGLTLQTAASTGYSVASGGLSLANGTAVTTQITAMSSATGGCVLSLLDTAKLTSFLVLVLPSGNKISAQLTAGSYG
jgi:hypothetical protein